MKKECGVVQDLLVLYEDDVLKEESRRMVEEHIQGCEECMQVYENAGKELPAMEAVSGSSREEQETAANQVMKRLMKMSSQRIVGGLLLIVLIILIIITVGGNIYDNVTETNWGLSAVYLLPTEDISVEELYTLKSGDIYCRLKSDKKVNAWQFMDWGTPEGKLLESTDVSTLKQLSFRRSPVHELPCVHFLIGLQSAINISAFQGIEFLYRNIFRRQQVDGGKAPICFRHVVVDISSHCDDDQNDQNNQKQTPDNPLTAHLHQSFHNLICRGFLLFPGGSGYSLHSRKLFPCIFIYLHTFLTALYMLFHHPPALFLQYIVFIKNQ